MKFVLLGATGGEPLSEPTPIEPHHKADDLVHLHHARVRHSDYPLAT